MRIFCFILFIFFFGLLGNTTGHGGIRKIQLALSKFAVVQGNFNQKKNIKSLNLVLASSGTFKISKEKMIWNQISPIEGFYEISQKGIRHKENSQNEEFISQDKAPIVGTLSTMLLCALGGDEKCLNQFFIIENTKFVPKGKWSFNLKPKSEPFSKVIKSIVVEGHGPFVGKVQIFELQGNTTEIVFYNLTGE